MINYFVTMAMGVAIGFVALGPASMALDAIEARRCPGRTRVPMAAVGTSWGRWGACPTHFTSLPD